ncbi:uncharacterized protein [Triticum aestivum]|uniref:uncharacterized protein n=1 Tax=Triticum aestivum TaxID=4565 RepID=UPI001D01FA0B|nr:uncharacterized protein LOC123075915 [Triticum aestivum]
MAAAWENNTSMEDTAAAMTAVSLPDDALLEILLRVGDAAALFRCAIACKRWCGLVGDPSFLRSWWPEHACPSLAGFFVQNQRGAKMLVPTPRSALRRGLRHTVSSFVPAETAELLSHAVPLVSRRGLLLVHLVRAEDKDSRVIHMAVCNLLDGTCNELPPLELDCYARHFYYKQRCYAVLTGADCHDGDGEHPPSFYKVLIVATSHRNQIDQKFDLETFSSDEASWSRRRVCLHATIAANALGSLCQSDAVVLHGTPHWLFRSNKGQCFYLVKLDSHEDHLSFTRLPIPMIRYSDHRPCLSLDTDGTLSVLHTEKEGHHLVVWRQEENQWSVDGTTQWLNTRTIELIEPGDKETQGRKIHCMLGEKCGKLLVKDRHGQAYTTDLETGAMEEVEHWSHVRPDGNPDVVLLEMDWPAFFVSRLATASESRLPLSCPSGEAAARRRRRHRRRGGRKTRSRGKASDRGEEVTGCST